MNKTLKRIIIILFLVLLLILYLINSTLIIKSIISYSKLFLTKLFPVSFIFFTISSLLIDFGLIQLISYYLKLNTSTLYIFIMSLISGFPSGAKYTKELLEKNLLTSSEANKIIMSTHFPNPLFVLGTVNLIIDNKVLSIKILISLILSNILLFLLFKDKNKTDFSFNNSNSNNFSFSLQKAITSSFTVLETIYGTSLFFYLVATIISHYLSLTPFYYVLLNGLFDLTKGISSLILLSNSLTKAILAICFISFGGIAIHMQVKSILTDTSIKYKNFLYGRFLGTFFALIIFLIIYKF